MKLRVHILVFLLVFGLTPLLVAVAINLPLVLERTALFYQRAYLQNLRADFRDLDQHLASRHEMIRLLAKLPEPGLILGEQGEADQIDLARARYTGWINQILADQRDIIQVLFVAGDGSERFWLTRDPATQTWRPTARPPQTPSAEFLDAGLRLQPGAVMVSRIRVDPEAGAEDPRKLITLSLVSRIGGSDSASAEGVVVMGIDVGGLAQFYRDTVWVNQDGSYLRPGSPSEVTATAFADFPGLADIFTEGKLAVWKGSHGRQLLWVPMFLTEDGLPLWVGRAVDPSPIDDFRNALMLRVLSIILVLVAVVMVLARWIAARAERFGQELTGGIGHILRDGKPLRFRWRGPREVRELGDQLTALAETHADHLRAAREHTRELERTNRYKSEFLANVSHELRTPLNSILLLSKMLGAEGNGLTEDQRRQAHVIHEAGSDLRNLIDNILDISRIEAGHVDLSSDWVELRPTLAELLELVRPLAADKPVRLALTVSPHAPEGLHTDREKLRQILKNFLSNAIKFTDSGEVTLALDASPEPNRPVALWVADTGIGIPLDKQDIIFEAFQQADGSTRRRYGGTGLGLSISRELASLLGGCIEVESSPGRGSRFELRLPLVLPSEGEAATPPELSTTPNRPETATGGAHAPSEPTSPGHPEPKRPDEGHADEVHPDDAPWESAPGTLAARPGQWVLILDRDVRNLMRLSELIGAAGLAVQTAADLDEALETLQEDAEGCVLVLMAAHGSESDTCATIETLLKQNRDHGTAVAVMGDEAAREQLRACRSAGAIDLIPKPVRAADLHRLLRTLPALAPGPEASPAAAVSHRGAVVEAEPASHHR